MGRHYPSLYVYVCICVCVRIHLCVFSASANNLLQGGREGASKRQCSFFICLCLVNAFDLARGTQTCRKLNSLVMKALWVLSHKASCTSPGPNHPLFMLHLGRAVSPSRSPPLCIPHSASPYSDTLYLKQLCSTLYINNPPSSLLSSLLSQPQDH